MKNRKRFILKMNRLGASVLGYHKAIVGQAKCLGDAAGILVDLARGILQRVTLTVENREVIMNVYCHFMDLMFDCDTLASTITRSGNPGRDRKSIGRLRRFSIQCDRLEDRMTMIRDEIEQMQAVIE